MIVVEFTEDKFGKLMKYASEIVMEIVKNMTMTICTVLAMVCVVVADVLIDQNNGLA